ncbi:MULTISPECIES: serine/threonine-protein kinase [Streptomyces]|uniref:serine/threonine-protein kinase n=1 Tax=Streptomyces TaxID=1883 RepID=UPI0022490A71|nr:serine/threonine-protein kinase [Streptomyces sp. JHD 1]MCX2971656.1 serine/threonine-protein kinase [Streptomyces sp. JHD 1]
MGREPEPTRWQAYLGAEDAGLTPPAWTRAAAVDAEAPTVRTGFGPFRIAHRLGAGGMGEVYLCVAPDGVLAAVKSLRSELLGDERMRRRFAREVQAARRVRSPFVVPVTAADVESAAPWLAQAFVPAPDLRRVVDGLGPLPESAVRGLGAALGEALAGIHAAGVIHRDLKPGNVLLTADGPRVIDFGIARTEGNTLTAGEVWGTPGFMSPEQLTGAGRVTGAADVFSLGVLLCYVATGRLPWRGRGAAELRRLTLECRPDLSALAPGVRETVAACLAPVPADRPAPGELAARLGVAAGSFALDGRSRAAVASYGQAVLRAVPDARALGAVLDRAADQRLRERVARLRERAAAVAGAGPTPGTGGPARGDAVALHRAFTELAEEAEEFYGAEHPEVFALRGQAARWDGEAGDPARAAFVLAQLVESAAVAVGPDSPEALELRRLRAAWLARAGSREEALLQQLDVLRRMAGAPAAWPPDGWELAAARAELAELYGRAGRVRSAADEYARLLAAVSPPATRDEHERVGEWRHQQAYWTHHFDAPRAVERFRSLYRDCGRRLGPGHGLTLAALEGQGYALDAAGDPRAALRVYAELLPRACARYGADGLEALQARASLAGLTGDAGDAAGAAELYAEVVESAVARWGEAHPRLAPWSRQAKVWRRRAAEQAGRPGTGGSPLPGPRARAGDPEPPRSRTAAGRPGTGAPGPHHTGGPSPATDRGPRTTAPDTRRSSMRWRFGRRGKGPATRRARATAPAPRPPAATIGDVLETVHPVFLPPDRFPRRLERVNRQLLPGLKSALAIRRGDDVSFPEPDQFSLDELERLWGAAIRNVSQLEGVRSTRTETGDGDVIVELWHPDDVFVASRAAVLDWLPTALFGDPAPEAILLCVPRMGDLLAAPARSATVTDLAGTLTRVAADLHAGAGNPARAVSPDVYLVTRGLQAQRVGRMVNGRVVVGGELLDALTGR